MSLRPDRHGQQLAVLGVGPQGNQVVQRRQAGFVFKHDAVVLGVGISVADGGVDGQLLDETVGQFRVVAAQQGDGVGRAREVLALGVTAQGLLQILDVEAAAEP